MFQVYQVISNLVTNYSLLTGLDKSEFTLIGEKLTLNNSKDYELDTRTYYLKLKLSDGSDTLIKTLTINLTNVDDIESKLKQTSFSVSENTTTVSNLDNSFNKR